MFPCTRAGLVHLAVSHRLMPLPSPVLVASGPAAWSGAPFSHRACCSSRDGRSGQAACDELRHAAGGPSADGRWRGTGDARGRSHCRRHVNTSERGRVLAAVFAGLTIAQALGAFR